MPQSLTVKRARTALSERLLARRGEIEQAVLTRVKAVSGAAEILDPDYEDGQRAAISAAVAYSLTTVELGEERSPPPPPILLAQARLAARNGVGLDTVLRRYFAGHALIGDYLVEEAEREGLERSLLQQMLRVQATLFDRLLAAISEEYSREASSRVDTSEERRAQRVERLLRGELLDWSELAYDLEGSHLGAVAAGPGAAKKLGDLADAVNQRLLLVRRPEGAAWAWLGSRRGIDPAEIERASESVRSFGTVLAVGEPAEGLEGWRLTHRQARAALSVALRRSMTFVRYADVALLASAARDEVLVTSLRKLYLDPLERERDRGEMARQTLSAYFAAGRNVSSAAAALGVNRHTVTSRLRAIEERIGRSLSDCSPEIEVALRLHGPGSKMAEL